MIKKDIVDLLDNILDKKKYSNIELNNFFNTKSYNYNEKSFIKNLLTLTIKNLIYVDYVIDKLTKSVSKKNIRHLLRLSITQIKFMNSDNKGVIYEANEVAKKINPYQSKFVNYILNKAIREMENIDSYIEENKLYHIKYSYPKWLFDKIKIDFPKNYMQILEAYKKRAYMSIRINKSELSKEEFEKNFKDDIVFNVEDVYYLSNTKNLDMLKETQYFIQDASSYIVAKNMNVKENEIILDACSSPGGKSATILNLYNPKKLIATDIFDHKIEILEKLKEKYNFSNMQIEKKDATKEKNYEKEYFDKILLDVPCSGIGVIRKKPEKIYNLSINDIKSIKKLQQKIFENNIEYLKVGGEIIYSTCTITKNENTNNVSKFLEKYSNLEVVELDIPQNVKYIKDEFNGVYISPENEYLDGFYIIKFRKIRDEN